MPRPWGVPITRGSRDCRLVRTDRPSMKLGHFVIAVLALFVASLEGSAGVANAASSEDAIQNAIHDYILAHPEVLIESLRLAKEREQMRLATLNKSLIASFRKELVDDAN